MIWIVFIYINIWFIKQLINTDQLAEIKTNLSFGR
jgi:hypothetical protein